MRMKPGEMDLIVKYKIPGEKKIRKRLIKTIPIRDRVIQRTLVQNMKKNTMYLSNTGTF